MQLNGWEKKKGKKSSYAHQQGKGKKGEHLLLCAREEGPMKLDGLRWGERGGRGRGITSCPLKDLNLREKNEEEMHRFFSSEGGKKVSVRKKGKFELPWRKKREFHSFGRYKRRECDADGLLFLSGRKPPISLLRETRGDLPNVALTGGGGRARSSSS